MKRVNLIPLSRQHIAQKKIANLKWLKGTGVYCAAVLLATIGSRALSIDLGIVIAQKIEDTQSRIVKEKAKLSGITHNIQTAQISLFANQKLRDQPNWSVLLKLVASKMDKSIVLTRCDLIPIYNKSLPVQGQIKEPIGYHFVIEGQGRSMININNFILRLEDENIFNQVVLDESYQQTFVKKSSNYFKLRCKLGQK